jgi:HEAT repeat protein
VKISGALALCAALLFARSNFAQESSAEEKMAKRFAELITMLKSDEYRVRKQAADEIIGMGEPVLPLLEKEKTSDDPEVRHRAEEITKEIKRLAVEKRIKEALKLCVLDEDADKLYRRFASPDEVERYDLLLRIAVKRSESTVPALKEFLKDPSDVIVDHALTALRSIITGKDETLALETLNIIDRTSPFASALDDRLQILLSFADLTNLSVIARMAALRDENVRLLLLSKAVLAPQKQHILFLSAFLSEKNEVARKFAASAIQLILGEFEGSKEIQYLDLSDTAKKFLIQNLTNGLKSDDVVVRAVAIRALGYTGTEEAAKTVRDLLQSGDQAIVSEAIKALGILRDKTAINSLLQFISPAEKRYAHLTEIAEALSRIKEKSTFEPLAALLDNKDLPFAEVVVDALCEIDANRAAPLLVKLLAHKNESVCAVATAHLGQVLKNSVALRVLLLDDVLKKLSSEDASEQSAAAKVICEVKDTAALPELKRLVTSQDVHVRSIALLPLAMVGGAETKQIIEDALKSDNYIIRVRASQALAYLGDWKYFTVERFVTLGFENDPIPVALRKISWDTGANIMLDPATMKAEDLQTFRVTFTAKRKPLRDVLDEILKAKNLTFQTKFHAIYVTTPERAEILRQFSSGVEKGGEKLAERLPKERVTVDAACEQIERFFQNLSSRTGISFEISQEASKSLAPELLTVDLALLEVPLDALLRLVLAPRALTYSCTQTGVVIRLSK